jgi:hypothetical protein
MLKHWVARAFRHARLALCKDVIRVNLLFGGTKGHARRQPQGFVGMWKYP